MSVSQHSQGEREREREEYVRTVGKCVSKKRKEERSMLMNTHTEKQAWP